jgi:hypothetical protein
MYCKPEKELSQIALRRIFEEAFSDRGPALEFFTALSSYSLNQAHKGAQ